MRDEVCIAQLLFGVKQDLLGDVTCFSERSLVVNSRHNTRIPMGVQQEGFGLIRSFDEEVSLTFAAKVQVMKFLELPEYLPLRIAPLRVRTRQVIHCILVYVVVCY